MDPAGTNRPVDPPIRDRRPEQRGTVLDSERGDVATPAGSLPRASNEASTPGSVEPGYESADGRKFVDRGRR
jgi:hypothetical protein